MRYVAMLVVIVMVAGCGVLRPAPDHAGIQSPGDAADGGSAASGSGNGNGSR